MNGIEVIQWLFDCGPVARAFGFPVHVEGLIDAGRRVAALVNNPDAQAADVATAYEKLAGAIGPEVMKALLVDEDSIQEFNYSGKPIPPAGGDIVLFVDKSGRRVVATTPKTHGIAPQFTVSQ